MFHPRHNRAAGRGSGRKPPSVRTARPGHRGVCRYPCL